MKEFSSLLECGTYLATVVAAEMTQQHHALDRAAKVIQDEAKSMYGEYQGGAYPVAPWAELADATKADRVRKGFPENEPLLRTGESRDSIERQVLDGETAAVGSNEDKVVYNELGTATIPPRSTLALAAVRKGDAVAQIIGESVAATLTGQKVVGGAMPLK